tara:strand:- start:77723 stop:78130 length:408 start_codon:yes stop_codon:yes gene_type:complete
MKTLFESWRMFLNETISINGMPINVEISHSPDSIKKGLMHRKNLDNNSGMLFCFPDQKDRSFWMKNTQIPLSIAYANSDGSILNIEDMTPHSMSPIKSMGPAQYALEMNQGWFDQNNVKPGDIIKGIKEKLGNIY